MFDEIDRQILRLLLADGRMPNNALADAVGIAPSTCLGRVRALRRSGVIRGYHADVDTRALGLPLQAVVGIRTAPHSRSKADEFLACLCALPGVLSAFHVTGPIDYLAHVAAESVHALRDVVGTRIATHPIVVNTETSLVFEHVYAPTGN
ncbi:Lrp/AsnC family transcriptional regulator [Kribbella sp. NPDC004536]|uniref:Lrp/AsnC family transcriptional regulator n=1 Tax=Kribbella sp. NPDC004536 TaxID=3364106 RepID=UPI0036813725